MTEKRFTYRYNSDCESVWEIIDLDDDVYYGMDTTENCVKSLVELLNELFGENEQLKKYFDIPIDSIGKSMSIKELLENYGQLKKEYQKLKHRHGLLHDECLDVECERDSLKKDVKSLEKENEQLKKDVEYWKQVASQYSNELNVFEHCKRHKTECKDIYWSSDDE